MRVTREVRFILLATVCVALVRIETPQPQIPDFLPRLHQYTGHSPMMSKLLQNVVSRGRISARTNPGEEAPAPTPGEQPIVILRVQVVGCADLLASDRGGTSDP